MSLDNSKIANETFYLMKKGRKTFYTADDIQEKERGLLEYARGLKKFELWVIRNLTLLPLSFV